MLDCYNIEFVSLRPRSQPIWVTGVSEPFKQKNMSPTFARLLGGGKMGVPLKTSQMWPISTIKPSRCAHTHASRPPAWGVVFYVISKSCTLFKSNGLTSAAACRLVLWRGGPALCLMCDVARYFRIGQFQNRLAAGP